MTCRLIQCLASIALACSSASFGQGLPVAPPDAGDAGHAQLTRVDAEAWLDGFMPASLDGALIPGAVVSIVKDGQLLIQKGYGVANWEKQTPVDPQSTLFRMGSISKLFTWTAVMQLVEQGKLDLDTDVNHYLDFKVPARDGVPLTLRQFITHTTGFEEANRDIATLDGPTPNLGDWVKKHLPPQAFAAGTTPTYSNYAAALAGRIVELASGQSFDDYVEAHIFAPLGMKNSTMRQPLPASFQAHLATGYLTRDDVGRGFETINAPPCGSLTTTSADISRFMLAYLNNGRLGDAQILKPETVRLMQTTITRALPDLNGMALGFYEDGINGHRIIGHAGDTLYFHSNLKLFLDDHVGIFVALNALGKDGQGGHVRDELFQKFADRYFPATQSNTVPLQSSTELEHDKLLAGTYFSSRGSFSNFLSVAALLSPMTVVANDNGTIQVNVYGDLRTYTETSNPFHWRQLGGKDRLEAIVVDGRVARWSVDDLSIESVFEPMQGLAATPGIVPAIVGALLVALLTTLSWPIAAFARSYYGTPVSRRDSAFYALRWTRISSLTAIAAIGAWSGVIAWLAIRYTDIPLAVLTAQTLSLVAFVGGLAAALWRAWAVFKPGFSYWARAMSIIWVGAFGVLLAAASSFHLVGFNPNY